MSDLSALSQTARDLIAATEALVAQYPDSVVYEVPENGDYDHRCTNQGLLGAQLCTRLTAAEAVAWFNTVRPPGTSRQWVLDDGEPVQCDHFPLDHVHVLVEC